MCVKCFIVSLINHLSIFSHDSTEATYAYTVEELVAELQARISNALQSEAFAIDILAAVVSAFVLK